MSISLKAGGNYVVYTGKAQSGSAAFASILSYLTIAYYWNNLTGLYEQVITTTTMVPYGCYWVEVTQNCTWTYGAEATAPTSVQLYARDEGNLVAYCGPTQAVELAIASISAYFVRAAYFDNTTKGWLLYSPGVPSDLTTMVRNNPYWVKVSQNCVWSFAARVPLAQIIKIDAPSSSPAGEYVIFDVHLKNNSTNYIRLAVTGAYDSISLSWQFNYLDFLPYETLIFRGWFTMPSKNVRATIWSWYWDAGLGKFVLDETKYVDISLAEFVPTFSEFAVTSFSKA